MNPGLGTAAFVAAALVILAGAGGDSAPVSDAVLAELEAANRARSELAREEAGWHRERERLELLASTLDGEIVRLKNERATTDMTLETLRREAANDPGDAKVTERTELARLCARLINERLDALASVTPPGAIPGATPEQSQALASLEAAAQRLDQAERRVADISVEVVTGRLDGHERAVKLLRLGGALSWWVGLDGAGAGTATMGGGSLVLKPAHNDEEARDIRDAVEIAEGLREPRFVTLPIRDVAIAPEGQSP